MVFNYGNMMNIMEKSPPIRKKRWRSEGETVENKMGASNAMVACAQKKGKTMKLISVLHPGGGSKEALRTIVTGPPRMSI